MVRTTKGFRRETRKKLKAPVRHKFKPENYLKEFKAKDRVIINIDPSSHKGMPFPKFKGKIGEIVKKRGGAYIVNLRIGKKIKQIVAKPEHLKLAG